MSKKLSVLVLIMGLLFTVVGVAVGQTDDVVIEVWSHFANEPTTRAIIEGVFDAYEAQNPNVTVNITWWDKNPLRDAIRSLMLSGSDDAPDITTFDTEDVDWVEAGWLADISDALPWDNFILGTREAETYAGIDGVYKFDFAFTVDYLLYNREIFAELGIEVPEDFQFTQDEFLDVVSTCNDAGYAGVADAIGNRPYPGTYPTVTALLNRVGSEEYGRYMRGEQSWDTPEVRQVFQWVADLTDAGLWPATFSTMTVDEYHLYFHTQRQACMLYNGTWYTARAFAPMENGGQDPEFHFGMLRYPEMNDAQGNSLLRGGFPTGYSILSSSEHQDVAKDIFAFWASSPEFGAMQALMNNAPSAIRYTPEDIPADLMDNPWQWYWDEFSMVYDELEVDVLSGLACGNFSEAMVSVLNEGLPLGLLSVDDAIGMLDDALCD